MWLLCRHAKIKSRKPVKRYSRSEHAIAGCSCVDSWMGHADARFVASHSPHAWGKEEFPHKLGSRYSPAYDHSPLIPCTSIEIKKPELVSSDFSFFYLAVRYGWGVGGTNNFAASSAVSGMPFMIQRIKASMASGLRCPLGGMTPIISSLGFAGSMIGVPWMTCRK